MCDPETIRALLPRETIMTTTATPLFTAEHFVYSLSSLFFPFTPLFLAHPTLLFLKPTLSFLATVNL